jgi:manganese transport protein
LGSNPILAQIATQVASVFVLPLVIAGILVLVNNRNLMNDHKAGILLNFGLIMAFIFSLIISYNGILGLAEYLFQ